jgi:putative SOS response-associated peptidase YedK
MCTRYVLTDPADAIRNLFRVTGPMPNWPPNYNVAPTHIMPVVRPNKERTEREVAMMEWGMVPWFSKDGARQWNTFNARSETVRTSATYKGPFLKQRCIVPATGYIEFSGPKGAKVAHYFTRIDGQPIALAGLWERWTSKDKSERKETFTVVTTDPNGFAAEIHDRMPMVLEMDDVETWLRAEPDEAAKLMKPAKDGVLQQRTLGKAINNVKNTGPELLA